MGVGINIKCNDCNIEYSVNLGVGFLFPVVYAETLEKAKSGELGEELKAFFAEHKDGAINADDVALYCETCGNMETGQDLSCYVPVEGYDPSSKEKLRWSVSFPAEGMDYVAPNDLEEKYRKVIEYPHKCGKCSGNMRIVDEEEFWHFKCPKCKKEMERLPNDFWD